MFNVNHDNIINTKNKILKDNNICISIDDLYIIESRYKLYIKDILVKILLKYDIDKIYIGFSSNDNIIYTEHEPYSIHMVSEKPTYISRYKNYSPIFVIIPTNNNKKFISELKMVS